MLMRHVETTGKYDQISDYSGPLILPYILIVVSAEGTYFRLAKRHITRDKYNN
jgi:hypothetical protein